MSEEWMAAHKGRYLYTQGFIWECGDECHCEQACVVDYFENKTDIRWRVPINVWEGTFVVGENCDPADPSPDRELAEYRRSLRENDPEREATIKWQDGVDYEGAQRQTR